MRVLAILRAQQFSPNSVEKDAAIMAAVAERLRSQGHEVDTISEDNCHTAEGCHTDLVLTMGRLPETQAWLKQLQGVRIVNRPEAIELCARCTLEAVMEAHHIPHAPREGAHGYWLKRGDAAAQTRGDVVYAADEKELNTKIKEFETRGIRSYVVSAHLRGDLVKFYGVRGSGFFRYYYPTDDGESKFGDERRNGTARHYQFPAADLQQASERLASAVGIDVYGGDCIVAADGRFSIIDFNDWPSFSRCREEAATAIATIAVPGANK